MIKGNNRYTLFFLVAASLTACNQQGQPEAENTEKAAPTPQVLNMTGNWQTRSIYVERNTIKGTEHSDTIYLKESDFPTMLGIKSNRGHYGEDGTFEELYVGLADTVTGKVSGHWDMNGDTLIVFQQLPAADTFRYVFRFENRLGIFQGYVDWDRDGADDDYFISIAEKEQ